MHASRDIDMRGRVLLVEPNVDVARSIATLLTLNHYAIVTVATGQEAIARIGAEDFDVMVVDVKVSPEDSGLPFLRHLTDHAPHLVPRIVVISGHSSEEVRRELEAIGVCDVVPKPVDADEIVNAVRECLDRMPATVQ